MPHEQRRNLTVRSYPIDPTTWDEKTRSINATIASELPVMVFDMRRFEPVFEVLRMDGAIIPESGQVPLLDSHDRTTIQKVLGSSRDMEIKDGKMICRNCISEAEPDAATKVREGHVTDNSVGYTVHEFTDIEPGETREVMGKSYTAPDSMTLRITTSFTTRENSLLCIGADASAKNREDYDQETTMKKDAKTPASAPPTDPTPAAPKAPEAPAEPTEMRAEMTDLKTQILAITPPGFEDFAARHIIDGTILETYRENLKEEFTTRTKPVGTPEPADIQSSDPVNDATDVDKLSDDQMTRALIG